MLMASVVRRTRLRLRWPHVRSGGGAVLLSSVTIEGEDVSVGRSTRLRRNMFIRGPQVRIGSRVSCNDGVHINHHVTVEDDVSIGQFSRLITGDHELAGRDHRGGPTTASPIAVGRGTWIGASVTVLPGVTIGRGCVIAAGAMVTADCVKDTHYAGVPARWKRSLPMGRAA